jgi:hypothetical protein
MCKVAMYALYDGILLHAYGKFSIIIEKKNNPDKHEVT